jgi:aryl-alcohol dehydrogenase-like predicted oxidoreductase
MELRQLGKCGLQVPALCFGAGTFGGTTEFFRAWGTTDVQEAIRLVAICLEAGVNFFDTADVYSQGASEEILGEAIRQVSRDAVIISTKGTFPFGPGPNNMGSSRHRLMRQIEGSLKRLKTDYIDVYHMHGFDALTPIEETLSTLDEAIRQGKIRYIAASNFSGWHMQKSLDISARYGWSPYVCHQVYYSLVGRDYEWELMPLAFSEGLGALVWSPLGWGRLTGKIRRGQPLPEVSRLHKAADPGPKVPEEYLYKVVDALDALAEQTGKSVPQLALNWLLRKPTISSVIIGARDETQLRDNLHAVDFVLTAEQVARLDEASQPAVAYPYWHQRQFTSRNPLPPSYRG